jgi:hypothetical protein
MRIGCRAFFFSEQFGVAINSVSDGTPNAPVFTRRSGSDWRWIFSPSGAIYDLRLGCLPCQLVGSVYLCVASGCERFTGKGIWSAQKTAWNGRPTSNDPNARWIEMI